MVKHVSIFLLHPMLSCLLLLLLNCFFKFFSFNRLKFNCRILIFVKVQLFNHIKMVLHMLWNSLLPIFNRYFFIPIILNSLFSCWNFIVIISFWSFTLASYRILINRFNCCVQIFSIHSFKSTFSRLLILVNSLVVKVLNFLFLRNGKHKTTFICWRYFSLWTFQTFIELLLD